MTGMETTVDRPAPPHRGRPRSDRATQAILEAAAAVLEARGLRAMTIEEVAARAGVGKATIYRWWATKGTLALDAFLTEMIAVQPLPDTGSLRRDVRAALRAWSRMVTGTPVGPALAGIVAEAQTDPQLAAAWRAQVIDPLRARVRRMFEQAVARGELPAAAEVEVALDLLYGAVSHRLLEGRGPRTGRFLERAAGLVLAGLTAGPAEPPPPAAAGPLAIGGAQAHSRRGTELDRRAGPGGR